MWVHHIVIFLHKLVVAHSPDHVCVD
eukprot:SAG31_NODE_25410_length_462_cov_0.559229_2_plen_25_part_01